MTTRIDLRYPCYANMYLINKKADRDEKKRRQLDAFRLVAAVVWGIIIGSLFVLNF